MIEVETAQATVVVIDDENDVLAGLSKILGSAGYACHCASDPRSALELVKRIKPDLILSDINLDGQSGLTLCEELKKHESLRDVPLMFISGAQIPDVIRRSHAAGGVYYLRKPFDPQVLLELIDKALWMPHLVGNQLSRA